MIRGQCHLIMCSKIIQIGSQEEEKHYSGAYRLIPQGGIKITLAWIWGILLVGSTILLVKTEERDNISASLGFEGGIREFWEV